MIQHRHQESWTMNETTQTHDQRAIRSAILATPFSWSNVYGKEIPTPETLYVPPSHAKALRLESGLVIGGPGVGKSFLMAAMASQNPLLRQYLGYLEPDLIQAEVHVCFSDRHPPLSSSDFPDAKAFKTMMGEGIDPHHIFKAVILRWLGRRANKPLPDTWDSLIQWMLNNQDEAAVLIKSSRQSFSTSSTPGGLLLFDAPTGDDPHATAAMLRGMLRTAMWLKPYPWLKAKIFARNDQLAHMEADFLSSMVALAKTVELTWATHDLHGLLWHRMVNAPAGHGTVLRNLHSSVTGVELEEIGGAFQQPRSSKLDKDMQRTLFESLTGPRIGKENHLADSYGRTSPRTFMAAIHLATLNSHNTGPLPIQPESLRKVTAQAATVRIHELCKDHPWVSTTLDSLSGLSVPCEADVIVDRWMTSWTGSQNYTPAATEVEWHGILRNLISLGVFHRKEDGRLDMSDLYRVGCGLGRKGGIKPKASGAIPNPTIHHRSTPASR